MLALIQSISLKYQLQGGNSYQKTRTKMGKVIGNLGERKIVFSTNISKKLQPSEQEILTYSIYKKNNAEPTSAITSDFCDIVPDSWQQF